MIVYLSEDNLLAKIIFSNSYKTILSFISGSALASQHNTAIYRFFTKPKQYSRRFLFFQEGKPHFMQNRFDRCQPDLLYGIVRMECPLILTEEFHYTL